MRSLISKKHFSDLLCTNIRPEAEKNEAAAVVVEEEEEEYDDGDNPISVTTHLYLKPAQSMDRLDKEVVLRRIRHRKRVSKVKQSAPLALLNSKPLASKSTKPDHNNNNNNNNKSHSIPLMIKWVDDAFAAP